MPEYIEKGKVFNIIGNMQVEHHYDAVLLEVADKINDLPLIDIQPADTEEILKHLDSLMICVGNAYNTSHYLLESDMEFIEKQAKIIKGLLSNKSIKR